MSPHHVPTHCVACLRELGEPDRVQRSDSAPVLIWDCACGMEIRHMQREDRRLSAPLVPPSGRRLLQRSPADARTGFE